MALLVACHEEVPLGAWEPAVSSDGFGGAATATSAGTLTGAGADAGATTLTSTSTSTNGAPGTGGAAGESGNPGLPACLAPGVPGALNRAGAGFDPTELTTQWNWPSPVASMEWDLMVEREIVRTPMGAPVPTTGYYWAHQFSFEGGIDGFLGIQAEGGYNDEQPNSSVDWTKMAVFWLSGPPTEAELGDIAFPDARIGTVTAAGVFYWTIHARFDWQVCRAYHFRFGPESTETTDGSIWYGAWIEDTTAGVETFLGRMRLPVGSGQLSAFSLSRTMHIDFVANPTSCDIPAHASALFGMPRANAGEVVPESDMHRFDAPLSCPISRFTEFPGAVRHEVGVPPE